MGDDNVTQEQPSLESKDAGESALESKGDGEPGPDGGILPDSTAGSAGDVRPDGTSDPADVSHPSTTAAESRAEEVVTPLDFAAEAAARLFAEPKVSPAPQPQSQNDAVSNGAGAGSAAQPQATVTPLLCGRGCGNPPHRGGCPKVAVVTPGVVVKKAGESVAEKFGKRKKGTRANRSLKEALANASKEHYETADMILARLKETMPELAFAFPFLRKSYVHLLVYTDVDTDQDIITSAAIAGLPLVAGEVRMRRFPHTYAKGAEKAVVSVACPFCKASPGEPCITDGHSMAVGHYHGSRAHAAGQ